MTIADVACEVHDDVSSWTNIAFSPDSDRLAIGSVGKPGRVCVWNLTDLQSDPRVLQGHDGDIFCIEFNPQEGARFDLATSDRDQKIRLWDLDDSTPLRSSILLRGHTKPANSMAFSPDGRQLLTYAFGEVRFWEVDPQSLLERARVAAGRELSGEEREEYLVGALKVD